ncbi:MAG: immunity protein Imm33 domain-containing protein [Caulobacteraceae bacterium]
MTLVAQQKGICQRFGVEFFPSPPDLVAGVAENVCSGALPLNGLRHPPAGQTTGWYLWAGVDFSDADDFFAPWHVEHLQSYRPAVLPYLGLPPGWRFLLADGHEDVWFDPGLLEVP